MKIKVSLESGNPIYEQIQRQVLHLVGTGRLRPGEELPSIRSLASQLVVNPNTVARAYRELEASGVVVKRGTSGTFVADRGTALSTRQREDSLYRRVEELLVTVHEMGFTTKELISAIRKCDGWVNEPKRVKP
ncbi:MAG: GntR family transcriptional regulator [Planctomycetota bacterium]